MKKETIIHNNRKVTKTTKNNGTISYTQRGVYIGIDVKTGKKVTSSITAKTLRSLDRKIIQARLDFEAKGSTLKEIMAVDTFEELAEAWFSSFVNWVTSQIPSIVSEVILTHILYLSSETTNLRKLNHPISNYG